MVSDYSLSSLSQEILRLLNDSPLGLHRATMKNFVQEALEQGVVLPGVYWIQSALSRMAVDMQAYKRDPGTPVINYEANNADSQKWIIQAAGNGYTIKNFTTNTFLSLAEGVVPASYVPVTGNPTPVEWEIFRDGRYFIIRLASNKGLAMDLKYGGCKNSNPIILHDCHKEPTQQWILMPV
ncbi:hypothetical protein FRC03_005860 [Tulasnella sp. 419]|nr:hypothetical protein FRC03_005860 [Tulasnella sp. 419]